MFPSYLDLMSLALRYDDLCLIRILIQGMPKLLQHRVVACCFKKKYSM